LFYKNWGFYLEGVSDCPEPTHIIVKYPEFWCRFPLNLLVHYSDNRHKLEYVVDDGEIIINNVSDGNE